MSGSKITGIEYYLPKKTENSKQLKKNNPKWDIDRIFEKTGINKRYISSEKETTIDIAEKSIKKLIKKFPKTKIDFLILVTQTSPYRIPTAACMLQERLKLSKDIVAFDINLGCSGFIYALKVAVAFIKSKQAKNGLVVCADTYTKLISKNNAQCRPIFSDAAAATLISSSKKNEIGPFHLGTDGSGHNALELPQGKHEVVMNGSKVLTFAMNIVPENVRNLLKKIKIKVSNVDMFIFHQASQFILDNINRKLQIPKNKTFENISKVGNTISASIPIALKDASKKHIKNNSKVILAGYGVGLSWGSVLVKWKKIK
jgi:3-oxoacyl-[acyl-carrier-protein] synthase III